MYFYVIGAITKVLNCSRGFAMILNIAKIVGKSGCNCGCGEPQNLDAVAKIICLYNALS